MTITGAAESSAIEHLIVPPVRDLGEGYRGRRALPSAQKRTIGPFIFLDHFGPTVFRNDIATDVRPHPHIGLSSLTYLLEGEIVHRDSVGSVETVCAGEVNWMTAGSGIVHSERSPENVRAHGGTMFGQQIWVALPKALTLPSFDAEGASLTVVAGNAFGKTAPVPVHSDMMYVNVVLQAGAHLKVPPEHIERAVFIVSGEVEVAGQTGSFTEAQLVVFKPGAEIILSTLHGAHVMLVGGEPFPEQRHIYWNFVSSSQDRIEQAKEDWRLGRFPGVAGETEFIPLPPERSPAQGTVATEPKSI